MAMCPECGFTFAYRLPPEGAPRKRVRCPDCQAPIVPQAEPAPGKPMKPKPAAAVAAKPTAKTPPVPAAPPAPEPPKEEVFGFADAPPESAPPPEPVKKGKKDKKDKPEPKSLAPKLGKAEIKIKIRNIGDLDVWRHIHLAFLLLGIGALIGMIGPVLQAVALLLAYLNGPEYSTTTLLSLYDAGDDTPMAIGQYEALDQITFALTYIYGSEYVGTCRTLLILGSVAGFIQLGLWMTAYVFAFFGAPERYAASKQPFTLMGIGFVNFLLLLLLIFLPLIAVFRTGIVPLLGPEMALCNSGLGRKLPLHVFWSPTPALDTWISLIALTFRYLEPMLIGVWMWTIGMNLREEEVSNRGIALMNLAGGVLFLVLCYYMVALSGTSGVLVGLLRFLYLLWFAFQFGMFLLCFQGCMASREVMRKYLNADAKPETDDD